MENILESGMRKQRVFFEKIRLCRFYQKLTRFSIAARLSKKMNKEIPLQTLSSKLSRNSLKLQEFEYILEILDYEMEIKKLASIIEF